MDRTTIYDKIYACWLGKNIGGTLGTPVEGRMEVMELTWYPRLGEGGALPNDDLDLQLLNLHAMEQHGAGTTATHIAAEWTEHCFFPWDEYGYSGTAMRYGFKPPFSGTFDNHFTNCMGSPIRSEIWAAICAGNPKMAAYFAWQDAVVDHAGGEGVFGEIFNAALEAAAFESQDVPALIREALTYIPASSRTHGAVSLTLSLFERGVSLPEARTAILDAYGSPNFTDAPQNIAFELTGLLWGKDFEDAILKVVNLGYDTDCTVATCGAIWGILYGREGISDRWAAPIGDAITVSAAIRGFRAPSDLDELTRRCIKLNTALSLEDPNRFVITEEDESDFEVQHFTLPPDSRSDEAVCVDLRYGGDPVVAPEKPCTPTFTLTNHTTWPWKVTLSVECPDGLTCDTVDTLAISPEQSVRYCPIIRAVEGGSIPAERVYACRLAVRRHNCDSLWTTYHTPFTLLAPNRWNLNGKDVLVPACTVRFPTPSESGIYVAEATLSTPVARPTRLLCNCVDPVTVELDGEIIFKTEGKTLFLPAYHRVPAAQRWDGHLDAGRHTAKVTVRVAEGERDRLPFFVLSLNAPETVFEPGNFFSYIDDTLNGL